MNGKSKIVVVAFVVALLLMPIFSKVEAKPGMDKNNSKFLDFVLHVEFAKASDNYPSEWQWNPPSVMDDMVPPYSQYIASPPEGSQVLFVENRIWYLPPLPFPAERYVTIGDEKIDLNPSNLADLAQSDFYCVYDVTWLYKPYFGIYTLETTVTLNSPEYTGTIHILSIEKTIVDGLSMIGRGTFVGDGVINGQQVKLVGERNVLIDLSYTLPPTMEEKGTLQFQG